MAVRNCKEIGENLQKVITRLMANDNLVKLLYYTDADPLSHEALTDTQKKQEVFNKLIRFVPKIGATETLNPIIAIRIINGNKNSANNEFRNVHLGIEVFTPWDEWIIKNDNLRPFAILGEIQTSLDGKTVNGLGRLDGGDFFLSYLTDENTCYETSYQIITYD